ncbi:conserved hypothetical protein [Aggregatibacter aphrophilus NJ8700]|jgi:hypothetical protein|nr:conserved hypothetical protein [Aggregatibacter aphrophilus NJ8700]
MIAIFALPASQEWQYQANVANENYQNAQQQNVPQILTAVSLLKQTQQQQFQPQNAPIEAEILAKNEPHFVRSYFIINAPIRAGPELI